MNVNSQIPPAEMYPSDFDTVSTWYHRRTLQFRVPLDYTNKRPGKLMLSGKMRFKGSRDPRPGPKAIGVAFGLLVEDKTKGGGLDPDETRPCEEATAFQFWTPVGTDELLEIFAAAAEAVTKVIVDLHRHPGLAAVSPKRTDLHTETQL
ncbi:uncharacterized protein E0L32_002770 [Thyridium curvatum]|uniref:Uncharacterized protein n=1 Tax=Thyridium curvatum TaxID=1093900 RepID=A0A507BM54_9PEZI|nr:uncharacterized protein E0L32_002770 [Thyridium curvatum]TPX18261.1 hypothetical protein E0L32_002770 [Thyridium curvatum]